MTCQIPFVDDEMKRASGEKVEEVDHRDQVKLVTSDGTYATQSIFNTIL